MIVLSQHNTNTTFYTKLELHIQKNDGNDRQELQTYTNLHNNIDMNLY